MHACMTETGNCKKPSKGPSSSSNMCTRHFSVPLHPSLQPLLLSPAVSIHLGRHRGRQWTRPCPDIEPPHPDPLPCACALGISLLPQICVPPRSPYLRAVAISSLLHSHWNLNKALVAHSLCKSAKRPPCGRAVTRVATAKTIIICTRMFGFVAVWRMSSAKRVLECSEMRSKRNNSRLDEDDPKNVVAIRNLAGWYIYRRKSDANHVQDL